MSYLKGHGPKSVPQSEQLRSDQVANSAGGWAWNAEPYVRARRFLILGSEGGSYYASERKLTTDNIAGLRWCIANDGIALVDEIVKVSTEGRAPSNDPAIFALALAASEGDLLTRQAALSAVSAVCRIGTHLFTFASFIDEFSGWGRAKRRAIGRWYTEKEPEKLAYQLVKYPQRGGWSHRDLLRLSHPETEGMPLHPRLFDFATHGIPVEFGTTADEHPLRILEGYVHAMRSPSAEATARLIREYGLTREMVRTDHLTSPEVWDALLHAGDGMPMTAMIRNLATMTRVGLLTPGSEATRTVTERLADGEWLTRSRVHPIAVLKALYTYQAGHGLRGKHTWTPTTQIVDALDGSFYATFGNVKPSGKKHLLAVDISGSMDWSHAPIMDTPGLTPRVLAAAMALVTLATEPIAFAVGFSHTLVPLTISPRQRLDDVIRTMQRIPMGGTDCALPMIKALDERAEVEAFVTYTDSETWAGRVHPHVALTNYRRATGINSTMAVVGMVANGFTIADPQDERSLDVVGFDTSTPQLLSDFASGHLS